MKKLTGTLLKIRRRQLLSELKALGPVYSLILFLISIFSVSVCWNIRNSFDEISIADSILVFLIFLVHQSRKDLRFLQLLNEKFRSLLFTEYFLLTLPFIICTAAGKFFWLAPIIIATVYFITYIPTFPFVKSGKVRKLDFIPVKLFEWRSGIRSSYITFLLLYLSSWLLILFPFATLVFIWLLTAQISSFYQVCEPQNYFELTFSRSSSLWKIKIFPAVKISLLMIAPQLIIYSFIHSDLFFIPLIELILLLIIFIFNIVSKYAFYRPNEQQTAVTLYITIAQLSILIPFLIPVPLMLIFTWYGKAKNNIRYYTYAQD